MLRELDVLSDQVARRLGSRLAGVAQMFRGTVRNTLATTTELLDDGTAYVITGDIPAMWLRDSSAQLRPYMSLAASSEAFADLLVAVSRRQFAFIAHDSYANAFNREATGAHWDGEDDTDMSDLVWERKFELDSLCYPIFLAHEIASVTGRTDHLDVAFQAAARAIVETWTVETNHQLKSPYYFRRGGEGLSHDGRGAPVADVGLVWSGFRPSDDPCELNFNIPGNIHTALAAERLAELLETSNTELAAAARSRARTIRDAVAEHGLLRRDGGRSIYAYEVDGMGRSIIMDDANIPSLLSLPYLGWCQPEEPHYVATRKVILGDENPYFFQGRAANGIGSPHLGASPYAWPLAMAMRGLTSADPEEREGILLNIVATTGGTGLIHEGVNVDDPTDFTRPWFAWGNSLFSELVLAHVGLMPFGYSDAGFPVAASQED